jgi:hypothetical protein
MRRPFIRHECFADGGVFAGRQKPVCTSGLFDVCAGCGLVALTSRARRLKRSRPECGRIPAPATSR